MKCPSCGLDNSKVLESRSIEDNTVMKRRRSCMDCSFRFTTYERIEVIPLVVIKNDGSRELFNHEKVLRGLNDACKQRPIQFEQLEKIAHEVESQFISQGIYEVHSSDIGEFVLGKLMEIDDVAYIRFASVYQQFDDVRGFMEAITKLQRL